MKRFWLIILVVAMALAGCGGAKLAPAPVGEKAALAPVAEKAAAPKAGETSAPAALPTTKPAIQAGQKATAVPTEVQPDDTLSLDSREQGLDQLKSYRMRWQAEWQSTESDKNDSASWDWTEEYSSDPQALHWLWKVVNSSDAGNKGDWEMWQIGDTSYMSTTGDDNKKSCFSFSSDDQSQQMTKGLFSPNSLGSLHDAKFVGNDTVNGIKTRHYKYDEKGAALGGFGKVNGEVWVAIDGGYVVKDVMSWEGAAGLFGTGSSAKGSGKWTWELSDINAPISIKAPENCGGAAKGMPMMSDASEKSSFGDTITYKSASKMADAVAFYQKEMPAVGWQAEGEPQISDEFAMLAFSKDGQKAQVMLTNDEGKTQVMINVTKD